MRISELTCDICEFRGPYKKASSSHAHPELEIGGVPLNIWTPHYKLPSNQKNLRVKDRPGVLRFSDYLPRTKYDFSLNEGNTPLIEIELAGIHARCYLKDEGKNPTGSFKDRGMPLLVADAKSSGKSVIGIPSTGNAAISLSAYAKKAGLEAVLFIPESTSPEKLKLLEGKKVFDRDLIQSYEHFFRFCKINKEVHNGFPVTNVPYYQGVKTMAYEMFEQLKGRAPDWVVVPCGSGVDIVSQYYGFNDLLSMGLIKKLPRFVSVQIEGADPITVGFNSKIGNKSLVLNKVISSKAEAISSDTCFNSPKIMRLLKESDGIAISVTDREIDEANNDSNATGLEYSSRSVYAALRIMSGILDKTDSVVLIGTAKARGTN